MASNKFSGKDSSEQVKGSYAASKPYFLLDKVGRQPGELVSSV